MKLRTSKMDREVFPPDKRPLFYYITDRRQLSGISLAASIRRALVWGVDFIQIREKDLPERALYELTCRVVSMAKGTQCRILVNGRADVAIAAGADGVHLPSSGLQIRDVKAWSPKGFYAGVSVHSMREIRNACAEGADYILLGHLFPTASKEGLGPELGLKFLRKACSASTVPILGLGGINPESIGSVLEAGAVGIAGIGLFQQRVEFSKLKKMVPADYANL
jgi:thiamine-phosphate pyrophosphorylase